MSWKEKATSVGGYSVKLGGELLHRRLPQSLQARPVSSCEWGWRFAGRQPQQVVSSDYAMYVARIVVQLRWMPKTT